jgi:hypothetical protein
MTLSASNVRAIGREGVRVSRCADAVRSSSPAMNASTCSRRMLNAAVGVPLAGQEPAKSAPSSVR